jgi:hypothetical protein
MDAKPELAEAPEVEKITTSLDMMKRQRASSYAGEFSANRSLDAAIGGGAFQVLKRG